MKWELLVINIIIKLVGIGFTMAVLFDIFLKLENNTKFENTVYLLFGFFMLGLTITSL